MTELNISLDRLEDTISVFGSFDENIRLIEHELGVTVVSRHPEAADEIAYADFYERFPQVGGLIVNASAAGMWPRKDVDNICAIHPDRVDEMMRYATGVADVVYNPPETFLTQAAARAGKPWCTGLYMLVAQAVEAESIWQGRKMPEGLIETIMQEVHL